MNKVKKIIKINNNEKSLKVYFSEFEKLSNCKRIWISCKDDEKNIYVNLKIPVNFFIHLIGIQKLPMFKKIKNEHLINKIKKEKINFETITNSIKSLKKKKKNVNEIRNVNSKIIGLRNINSFEFEKIFKDFNYVSFNKNIIKKIFPFTSCDLCLIKKINNDEFILFHFQKMKKNYKLKNFCFVKSFIYLNDKNKEKINEINKMKLYKILSFKKISK